VLTKQKILDSVKKVVDQSSFVSIDEEAINKYVKGFVSTEIVHWNAVYPLGYKPRTKKEDEIDFLFILGNQAFCYWGYPAKWTIEYKGQKLDGWYGHIAAYERALERGMNLLDGEFLAGLTLEKTREIFAGEPEIPLLEKRWEIMKSIGQTLVEKYQGRFHNFFEAHQKDVFELTEAIAAEFAGFNDVPTYKGSEVFFYKKIQLVLIDISQKAETIPNIDDSHGFADYKIPAILRTLGILKYNEELGQKVDNRIELPEASEMEIEIRASMLWACYLIVEKLRTKHPTLNMADFENILWIESQDKAKIDKPYHLTRTVFY